MHRSALFLLLLTVTGLAADEKGRPRIRFLAERVPANAGQVALVAGDKRSADFALTTNHLSEPIEVPARTCQLRCKQPDVAIANLQLPESGDSFISLLVPASGGGYQAIVIPADTQAFKAGDVYFYNHSDQTILGYVGSSKFTIAAEKGQIIKPEGARAEKFYDVGFGVHAETGNRVLSTTRWPVDERSRSYVFFFKNPSNGRLDYRAVDEFVPPETQKTQANL
ncbi:hypothetical protein KBB96_19630 [Luteolibacter ambystomatis]|uniref:Uncharacterized protein n=1 Tax=Luteolibacter ambystomatis TaxID=2824561 RepID=A0A975G8J2_9BACT|nr:hypothetical protein [Luteolibacter ambystomatis]QUE51054.1 hypothetical protein KBB96_19630 [Luteolibacter ambystomatis]